MVKRQGVCRTRYNFLDDREIDGTINTNEHARKRYINAVQKMSNMPNTKRVSIKVSSNAPNAKIRCSKYVSEMRNPNVPITKKIVME